MGGSSTGTAGTGGLREAEACRSVSTLTICITTHDHPRLLHKVLGNMRYQTRRPDEILVYASRSEDGPIYDLTRFREEFPEARFWLTEDFRDWGHEKRAMGIDEASSDYIGFVADDDEYVPEYVERMMGELEKAPGTDAIYCDWSLGADVKFQFGSSTAGNFFVRVEKAREVGWTSREYAADGLFINAVNECSDSIAKIPENLYWHNKYPRDEYVGPLP